MWKERKSKLECVWFAGEMHGVRMNEWLNRIFQILRFVGMSIFLIDFRFMNVCVHI